ncbi:MAG TPA: OsmC family peroxiredoxin [Opitutaceae bacterium]|nr:OsmC family peroxiredoxin [Opitutaceae bacterium]
MRLIIRRASVRWTAGARGGARAATTESGVLTLAPFSSAAPHRNNSDTNSAELIAAAHAGSFSLALAEELGRDALSAGEIVTSAAVTLERIASEWAIINIHLNVVAKLPKVKQGRFIEAAVRAKTSCLVSRLLRTTVSINARLEK